MLKNVFLSAEPLSSPTRTSHRADVKAALYLLLTSTNITYAYRRFRTTYNTYSISTSKKLAGQSLLLFETMFLTKGWCSAWYALGTPSATTQRYTRIALLRITH